MKKHKKIIIGVCVVLVAVVVVKLALPAGSATQTEPIRTTALNPMTLTNTVSVKGVVESVEETKVYSSSTFAVDSVFVEVGDKVNEGDILCQLDTETLKITIAQQTAALNAANASAQHQLEMSEENYEFALNQYANDLNAQILSANSAAKQAEIAWESAVDTYNSAKDAYNQIKDSVASLQSQLAQAQEQVKQYTQLSDTLTTEIDNLGKELDALDPSAPDYDDKKAELEKQITDKTTQLEAAWDKLASAQTSVTETQAALNTAQSGYAEAESLYNSTSKQVESTRVAYDAAVEQKDAAQAAAKKELQTYENAIETSKLAANTESQRYELQKLQKQLNDATITAPISGTVTAVYATEGATGSGLLFVIEDTEHLKIATKIKEYDVHSVTPGMKAVIKSDATGDDEYEGTVDTIAPVAVKGASGDTVESTNVEFETEVLVDSTDTGLLIGMNARIDIVLESLDNVYGVPYDAVTTDEQGQSIVYVAREEKGGYVARAVPVTTGMETDFYIQIESDQLKDGDRVLNSTEGIQDGSRITLR